MSIERAMLPEQAPSAGGAASGAGLASAGPHLQILATEHWSLLATRSMSWNESFSRSAMFLSALSASVVALALVAQATAFGNGFAVFGLVLLPVVLFLGVATYVRLCQINVEDVHWVLAMNRIRHAYLELAPELTPYFSTGHTDDEAGVWQTAAADPGSNQFVHGFVTTPGMLAVVDSVVAAALAGLAALQLGSGTVGAVLAGVIAFLVTLGLLAVYQIRGYQRLRARQVARFPSTPTT